MPKNIKISLKGIVGQIDQATKNLKAAEGKAATAAGKKRLAIKIRKLGKVKKNVQMICHGLNIIVPTE